MIHTTSLFFFAWPNANAFTNPTAVQKERGPSKSNELKKELKQGLTNEISKKKQLKIAEFELKETAKEQFDLNNKLPLGEIKNYTTGKPVLIARPISDRFLTDPLSLSL